MPSGSESQSSSPHLLPAFSVLAALLASGYGVLFTLTGDYTVEFGVSESVIGWIIGVGFVASFFSQVVVGPLADRGRAKQLLLVGALVNCAGLIVMGFGTTATVLLLGRIVSGLGVGAALPAVKRLVVISSGEHLGRNLGRLFSAEVFGFAIGPAISAVLVEPFGLAAPFLVIVVLTLLAVIGIFLTIQVEEAADAEPRRFAFDLLRERPFAGAVLIGTAPYVMLGAFDTLWDLVHTDLETTDWLANLGITVFAIPLVLLGPLAGRLAQATGPFLLAAAGMAFGALFMGVYGVLTVGGAIIAVTLLHAVTDGLTFAASGVAVGMTAPESRQAGAQGVLGGVQALASGLTAIFIGWFYEHYGQQAAYWLSAAAMLVLTGLGLWLAGSAVRTTGVNRPDSI